MGLHRLGKQRSRHTGSGQIVFDDACIFRSENKRSAALTRYGSGSLLAHPRPAGT